MHPVYKILFNFPTRNRPTKFIEAVRNIKENVASREYCIVAKIDNDDSVMNNEEVVHNIDSIYGYQELHERQFLILHGDSKSKVEAVNADNEGWYNWDIMVVMSDDMKFIRPGFDKIIRNAMPPDLDWLVHFPDSYALDRVCTLPVIGKNYYKRDGFVYNPAYYSMFCDEEQTELAKLRGRYLYVPEPHIVDHYHYSNKRAYKDALYRRNDTYRKDEKIFKARKAANFNL